MESQVFPEEKNEKKEEVTVYLEMCMLLLVVQKC